MELLDILVFCHVAGAVSWVGGNSIIQVLGSRVIKTGTGNEIQKFVTDLVYLTPRWFIPVGIWTVAFGAASVIEAGYSFGDSWISMGLTMFIVSFVMGIAYLGPQAERIAKIGESEGFQSEAYVANVRKFLLASRIELGLLWLTVFVMVVKPG